MKLALARAMLQNADILLLDEPTNHLDVINVQWVQGYLNSLDNVTSIIVSHDSGLLNKCCTHILQIENLKLHLHKGNLSEFVKKVPAAMSFFSLAESKLKFKFPQPGFLEGVKSKGKALMKMEKCAFTYPGNDKPTISDITVQVSLSSRVACVGVNGAGKSTMIKLLTGQMEPQVGTVWKHANCRVAYVAQHAFHHIEKHLSKTANEYIRWRYESGEDKEGLEKVTMVMTAEEEALIKKPVVIDVMEESGKITKSKRVVERLSGARRNGKKGFEYEVMWTGLAMDSNMYLPQTQLEEMGFTKLMKVIDARLEARDGLYARPLTQENVEKHLEDVGLDREFGTHNRIAALSGGQKVKIVLAAAMWNQPHILILDEPTNYLDRDSLGALAGAIREYEGGVVMITHNNEFCSSLCPETWVLENGKLDCKGDPEWMLNATKEKQTEYKAIEEMVDANGNVIKVKKAKKVLSRKERMARDKRRKAAQELGEPFSESEEDDE
jgi:elongation factor 3